MIPIEITLQNLLTAGTLFFLALIAVGWLLQKWLSARIENSVRNIYERQLEDYRFGRLKRQKSELIAALFSKWLKYYGRETKFLDKEQLIAYYEELNRMSIELSLWLEDGKLLQDVMSRLQNTDGARSVRDLIGDVRKMVQEKKDNFDPQQVILWPPGNKVQEIYGDRPN